LTLETSVNAAAAAVKKLRFNMMEGSLEQREERKIEKKKRVAHC
jgi:hypothetical protein